MCRAALGWPAARSPPHGMGTRLGAGEGGARTGARPRWMPDYVHVASARGSSLLTGAAPAPAEQARGPRRGRSPPAQSRLRTGHPCLPCMDRAGGRNAICQTLCDVPCAGWHRHRTDLASLEITEPRPCALPRSGKSGAGGGSVHVGTRFAAHLVQGSPGARSHPPVTRHSCPRCPRRESPDRRPLQEERTPARHGPRDAAQCWARAGTPRRLASTPA